MMQARATLHTQHLLRKLESVESANPLLSFCSNDYLNLATHPDVILALQVGAAKYGLGSTGSPQISGFTKAHQQLEEEFAAFLQRDKALLFNSGYHANLGVLTTFANRHSLIVADKLCHASIIDGMVLSRAKYKRYHHNDCAHAESLLQAKSLLISDSVFSIPGDIADVKALAQAARNKAAMLIIDDAHGVGVLGANGFGITDHLQLNQHDVPCLITPFGKAIASMGAIVSGKSDMIDALIQYARTHRYSTALPPAIAVATSAILKIIKQEPWRRERLQQLIHFFIMQSKQRALPLISDALTPIKSFLIQSNQKTIRIQEKLRQHGLHVACIRPPTVPNNQACVRISLNASHTEEQITLLLDLLKDAIDEHTQ